MKNPAFPIDLPETAQPTLIFHHPLFLRQKECFQDFSLVQPMELW